MDSYCVKCRCKREMLEVEPTFTSTGVPATRGVCAICGTKMFRMGETPDHADLERPEPKPPRRRAQRRAPARKGKLVIVESPAKARTVGRYLGKGYRVKASVGHVRDLLRSRLSVDVDNDFEPTYRVPNDKRPIVKELQADVDRSETVYLATDPDREGEAIAWHLAAATGIPDEAVKRVVFNEVTEEAVKAAFDSPRDIDMDRVNAQQARRILDRLVGYQLSPLLWSKVRSRLSAGRVQSVAVRLIVEREREIDAFDPEEYWTIDAELAVASADREANRLTAALHHVDGAAPELPDEAAAEAVLADLEGAAWHVVQVRQRKRRRKPPAPHTTSTLQQDSVRMLRFSARKTMQLAQQLYEGVETGDGEPVGLITYMRTDSVSVAAGAREEAARYIDEHFGPDYLPDSPAEHESGTARSQDAHEAIRPTSVLRTPDSMKPHLTRGQHRLYDLIWRRFVASQMGQALYDTTSVDIGAGPEKQPPGERKYLFRVAGSVIRFEGFTAIWGSSQRDALLPRVEVGQELELVAFLPEQHFTQPPPRFSEASLVHSMEEHGIGRPSTYAPILSTIRQRGYVTLEERRFYPTELGFIVNDLLVEFFADVLNVGFTARMEDALDQIARGERDWVPVLHEFYRPFSRDLSRAEREMEEVEISDEEIGEECPECGAPLLLRLGRYGRFVGCSGFPDCRYTRPHQETIGVDCPQCDGEIAVKRTRRGRLFYGCANYPDCDYASWQRPLRESCPLCGSLLVAKGRDSAVCTSCSSRFELEELASDTKEESLTATEETRANP